MEVDFAVVADGVMTRPEGKFDIIGAGFDTILAPAAPARHARFVIAARLLLSAEEATSEHEVGGTLRDADGQELSQVGGPLPAVPEEVIAQVPADTGVGVALSLTFENVVFPAFGAYRLSIAWDGQEAWSRPIHVAEQPRPA